MLSDAARKVSSSDDDEGEGRQRFNAAYVPPVSNSADSTDSAYLPIAVSSRVPKHRHSDCDSDCDKNNEYEDVLTAAETEWTFAERFCSMEADYVGKLATMNVSFYRITRSGKQSCDFFILC